MTKPLAVLDIFSGIGGFSLGLERAGMETIAFCEIKSFCQKILKKHWRSVPIFSDITILTNKDFKTLPKIDVIAGGFPCQDISVAGKGGGIAAKRSGLWKEFARLINDIRPKYAIIENVANLRSQGLIIVLQDLWEIGYDAHIVYRLPPLAHLTDGIESGLLPTPLASAKPDSPAERKRVNPSLEAIVKMSSAIRFQGCKEVISLKKCAESPAKKLELTAILKDLPNGG